MAVPVYFPINSVVGFTFFHTLSRIYCLFLVFSYIFVSYRISIYSCESVSHSAESDLCDPMDCSPPASSVHGILQARILEWLAIPFSRGSSHPGIKPRSLGLQVNSLLSEPPGKPILYNLSLSLSFFFFFLTIYRGMHDLSPLNRDQTLPPAVEVQNLNQ